MTVSIVKYLRRDWASKFEPYCVQYKTTVDKLHAYHGMVQVMQAAYSSINFAETVDYYAKELHNSPSMYRSQQYYENWNRQYVSAWNFNAMSERKNSFFEPIVGYEYNVDYGFEINHELFYYFQYVEHVLKIQIMPGGPNAVFY